MTDQMFQVEGGGESVPFGADVFEAAQQELPGAEVLFDHAKGRSPGCLRWAYFAWPSSVAMRLARRSHCGSNWSREICCRFARPFIQSVCSGHSAQSAGSDW